MKLLDKLRVSPDIPLSNLIFTSLSSLVAIGAGFSIQFILTGHYGLADFGIYTQAIAFYNIIAIISVFGLDSYTVKAIGEDRNNLQAVNKKLTSLLSLSILQSVIVALVIAGLIQAFPSFTKNGQVQHFLLVLLIAIPFGTINKIFLGAVSGLYRIKAYSILQICRYVGLLLLLVFFIVRGLELQTALWMYLCNETLLLILFSTYLYGLKVRLNFSGLVANMKAQFVFAIPIFTITLGTILFSNIDIIVAGYFLPDSQVGSLGFALNIAKGFLLLPSVMQVNINPLIAQHTKTGNHGQLNKMVSAVFRKNLLFVAAALVLVLLLYPIIPYKISKLDAPVENIMTFYILVSGFAVFSCFGFLGSFFTMAGKPKYQILILIISIPALVIFEIAAILISKNIIGAALAIAFSYVLAALLINYLIQSIYGIRILSKSE